MTVETPYLMESPEEGQRLLRQGEANPSRERLVKAGVRAGMQVADLGCGSGASLVDLAALVGPEGRVTGLDPSRARLDEARAVTRGLTNCELLEGALPSCPLPSHQLDLAFSQLVFEYFSDPRPALGEMIRLVRPGGRVVVADVDRSGSDFWPVPDAVHEGTDTFMGALGKVGFDLMVGRKMFHHFRRAGLTEVQVQASVHYLVAGEADQRLRDDWRTRFDTLEKVMVPAFGSAERYRRFTSAYLEMLDDADTLKFGLLLTTIGVVSPA